MFSRICLVLILSVSLGDASGAKTAKQDALTATIKVVSPLAITLSAGREIEHTYKLTDATKITLEGLPANVDDLRAGMVAKVTIASDDETLLSLSAKKAPRTTRKPPPVVIW